MKCKVDVSRESENFVMCVKTGRQLNVLKRLDLRNSPRKASYASSEASFSAILTTVQLFGTFVVGTKLSNLTRAVLVFATERKNNVNPACDRRRR